MRILFKSVLVTLLLASVGRMPAQQGGGQSSADDPARVLSVRSFGARPGIDSTASFRSAIASAGAGGRLYIPKDARYPGSGLAPTASVVNGMVSAITGIGGDNFCVAPDVALQGGGGVGAKFHARVSSACQVVEFIRDSAGSGYTSPPGVSLKSLPQCYLVGQIEFQAGMLIEGDGEASCIQWNGANSALPLMTAVDAERFTLRNLRVDCRNAARTWSADVGVFVSGGSKLDAANSTVQSVTIQFCGSKGLEMNHTYGWLLLGDVLVSNGTGLYLDAGYNNSTFVAGGEYSNNARDGVYLGPGTAQFDFHAIAEGNLANGLHYNGPILGLAINTAYFELNGNNGGYDVYGEGCARNPGTGYDCIARSVSIISTVFTATNERASVYVSYTPDFNFAHNIGNPPDPGKSGTRNRVILAHGTINPTFEGNTGFDIVNEAGSPVYDLPIALAENLFLWSADLTNKQAWQFSGTGSDCALNAPVCLDSALFLDHSSRAWRIPLGISSDSTHLMRMEQNLAGGPYKGHLAGAGIWARTNTGTVCGWIRIHDQYADYTGSDIQQSYRTIIDSNWKWLSLSAVTSNNESNSSIATIAGFTFYRLKDATSIYLYAPQAWSDISFVPGYAETQDRPVVRQLLPGGHRAMPGVSPECPALSCSQPYTWIKSIAPDGSTVYTPAFK